MMGIFLTFLANSVTRATPLILCLLVCISCATPFPVENLEFGMTAKEVRESVGEPRFIHRDQTWIYTHEEWSWDEFYVVKKEAFLHFDRGLLTGWQVDGLGPQGVEESIVAIKVKIGGLAGSLYHLLNPPVIYFVRLEADGQIREGDLIRSNYRSGGYAYLVNASPGRYAALGAGAVSFNADLGHWQTGIYTGEHTWIESLDERSYYAGSTLWLFPESMIDETTVTVEPSGVAFMGEFKVSGRLHFDDADAVQKDYTNKLSDSEYARKNPIAELFERPPVESVRLVAEYQKAPSEMATQRFLKSSRGLAELGWRGLNGDE
jgi:hypothetical protein